MRRCLRCGQEYTDTDINFCFNDGELLREMADEPRQGRAAEDSPPTLVIDSPRIPNHGGWPQSPPTPGWEDAAVATRNPSFIPATYGHGNDKTLPTIALWLGLASCVFVCCYGGIWLGIPAAVVGFVGLRNVDTNPSRYTGRGMA
ncbi:MAG: hypothetical protein LC730_06765, partial [Acidobacteria bacterium]|nr:hypothetical protein [Acidobacteriota bacterium]